MFEYESEHAYFDLYRTFVLSSACVIASTFTQRLGELAESGTRASLGLAPAELTLRACATVFPNFSCSIHLGFSVGRHVAAYLPVGSSLVPLCYRGPFE